jgi:hypothetical protein
MISVVVSVEAINQSRNLAISPAENGVPRFWRLDGRDFRYMGSHEQSILILE